jgi:hypothetical protein
MTHTEHTPAPWRLNTDTLDIGDYAAIQGSNGTFIGAVWADNTQAPQADAKLIVKAVNSHERLIQALSELVAEHDVSNEDIKPGYGPKPDTFGIELARAALAEGETP